MFLISLLLKKVTKEGWAGYSRGEGGRLFEVKACGVGAYSGRTPIKTYALIVCNRMGPRAMED